MIKIYIGSIVYEPYYEGYLPIKIMIKKMILKIKNIK